MRSKEIIDIKIEKHYSTKEKRIKKTRIGKKDKQYLLKKIKSREGKK